MTKKERYLSCQELWSRNFERSSAGDSTFVYAHGHIGSCPGYALLTSQGEATGFRERIGTTILAREARRVCKDRVAERKRVREMRRARIERGAGDVLEEPGDKDNEQVAVEPKRKEKKERHPSEWCFESIEQAMFDGT